MEIEACLPPELRGPSTVITKMVAGLSGAGVYRVVVGDDAYVVKVAADDVPPARFRQRLDTLRLASAAGVAPRVVHADEARRAVVTAFVADRSLLALYHQPGTRDRALALLGKALRRVHDLPLAPDAFANDPRELLGSLVDGPLAGFTLPSFATGALRRTLAEEHPPAERRRVLSHNDVNPTNLVYDGERVLLLDWDTEGPNDPLYDLAAASVFLRMDDAASRTLLAEHDGAPVGALPPRFGYNKRLVSALSSAMFLHIARQNGHAGATGETLETALDLGGCYQRLRAGTLSPATAEGQWCFGLALARASLAS